MYSNMQTNKQFSYSTGGCATYTVHCTGYTSVYTVYCMSYVESNSVLLVVADDDTSTSAVSPTRQGKARRGAHEKTYEMRNRQRNVSASLEV